MRRLIIMLVVGLLLCLPLDVAADEPEPSSDSEPQAHTVKPGETLVTIAQRYGTDVTSLMRLNRLSDPRNIYVGQRLRLHSAPADVSSWQYHALQLGEDLSLLACRDSADVRTVAQVNGLLNPAVVLPGTSVLLPGQDEPSMLGTAGAGVTQLELAFRYGASLWEMVRSNPRPLYAGECVVLPETVAEDASNTLPYPLKSLTLSDQPIERGETVVLKVEAYAPVSCDVTYLDKTVNCFDQGEGQLYALLSLSPMLEPDTYEVKMRIRSEESEMAMTLPIVVTPGRFGFERIDLPPSRQALFDPDLLRYESNLVDSVANVRTAQRYWKLPFDYPVYSSVSSYFGARRSYGGSYNSYHSGVDFRASTGVPVKTPAGGTVIMAEALTVRGNAVIIDHGWGVLTGYWHLSKFDVEVGQRVEKGQIIGRVGNTGLSTGSHLHWQLWVDGKPVDPLQWTGEFYDFPDPKPPVERNAE